MTTNPYTYIGIALFVLLIDLAVTRFITASKKEVESIANLNRRYRRAWYATLYLDIGEFLFKLAFRFLYVFLIVKYLILIGWL